MPERGNPSDYGRIYPIGYHNPHTDEWNAINPFQYPTPPPHAAAGINLDIVPQTSNFDAPYIFERKPLQHYANIKDLDWESDEPQPTPTPSPSKHRVVTWNWRDSYIIRGGKVFKNIERDLELHQDANCPLVSVH